MKSSEVVSCSIVSDECVQADFAAVLYREFPDPSQEDPAFRLSKPTRRSSPPAFMATLTAIVLFGTTAWAQASNYYISASGPLGNGSGSSAANAVDASSASKYGAIVRAQSVAGTTIIYAAGTYLVSSPHLPAYNGVTHQGAGIDKTIIKFANNAVPSGASGGSWMWVTAAGTAPTNHFAFYDATIDFNPTNQGAWTLQNMCSVGFVFYTPNNTTLQRLKFINLCSQNAETFVIFLTPGVNGACTNNLIDSCIFTQPIPSGNVSSGMTVIMLSDYLPYTTVDNTNVVSNCQFLNLKYPEFSDIAYVTGVCSPVVQNCTATGIDGLWGCEPGSQNGANNGGMYTNQTCQVTGNTLVNTGRLGGILLHPDTHGAFGSVNIQNNTVSLDQHPYQFFGLLGPQFFLIQTAGGSGTSSIGNVTIQNNTVTTSPSPWTANPRLVVATSTSPSLFHVNSLTVINNQMIGFPGDGSELEVNKAQIGTYTNTGNTCGSALRPDRLPHQPPPPQTLAHRLH